MVGTLTVIGCLAAFGEAARLPGFEDELAGVLSPRERLEQDQNPRSAL
jgi:hypothetical protein